MINRRKRRVRRIEKEDFMGTKMKASGYKGRDRRPVGPQDKEATTVITHKIGHSRSSLWSFGSPGRRTLPFLIFVSFCSISFAQVPLQFNYQGRLTDSNGIPVVGVSTGTFNIYKGGTVMGDGTNVFSETWTNLQTDASGVFSAAIGSISNMPLAALADGTMSNRYIEVVINGQTNLPRQQMVSVPYAVHAASVPSGSITALELANNSVGTDNIVDGSVQEADMALRIQRGAGSINVNGLVFGGQAGVGITFSPPFSSPPIVVVSSADPGGNWQEYMTCRTTTISASGFECWVVMPFGEGFSSSGTFEFNWIAVGQ